MRFKEYLAEATARYTIEVSKVTSSGRGNLIKIMKWVSGKGSHAYLYYGENTSTAMKAAKLDLALLNAGKKAIHYKAFKDAKQMMLTQPAGYLDEQNLSEINIKHAAAIGALTAATMLPGNANHKQQSMPKPTTVSVAKKISEVERLTQAVVKNWDVTEKDATKIVKLAIKYEKPKFPKAKDILAVIGLESEFDPMAQSELKDDPAIGLMQVRPGVWGISASSIKNNVEQQIKVGTNILSDYFDKLNSPSAALHAYNIGITLFNKGKTNQRYVDKFNKARKLLDV